VLSLALHPPTSTVFPYTTLFRSSSQIACLNQNSFLREPSGLFRNTEEAKSYLKFVFSAGEPVASGLGCYTNATKKRSRMIVKMRSEEHTSELQSRENLVCRLLLE